MLFASDCTDPEPGDLCSLSIAAVKAAGRRQTQLHPEHLVIPSAARRLVLRPPRPNRTVCFPATRNPFKKLTSLQRRESQSTSANEGYIPFELAGFKLGKLRISVAWPIPRHRDAEQRGQLKLPVFVRDLRVENGGLEIRPKVGPQRHAGP